jgi:hypothetical protein
VTINALLAFGILLNIGALNIEQMPQPCGAGVRAGVEPALFDHLTSETNP